MRHYSHSGYVKYSDHNLGWFVAIALGVLLGLYVESCTADNTPEAQTRQLEVLARACRTPGFVVMEGVVRATPDPEEFTLDGGLTLTGPSRGVAVAVLTALARDGRRFQIVAVPQ